MENKTCRICPNPASPYSWWRYCRSCHSRFQYWLLKTRMNDPKAPRCISCHRKGQYARKMCRNCHAIWYRTNGKRTRPLYIDPDCKYCINPKFKKCKVAICYFCWRQIVNKRSQLKYYHNGGYAGLSEKSKQSMRKGHRQYYYKYREDNLKWQAAYYRRTYQFKNPADALVKFNLYGSLCYLQELILSHPEYSRWTFYFWLNPFRISKQEWGQMKRLNENKCK